VHKKVVVVGVDAGSFHVINPMLKEGLLPTFEKILKEGASGVLMSTMPPSTPPAWASFATGVNPGKHAVFDFWHFDGTNVTPVTSYSIRRRTLWSTLTEENMSSILINAPITYPPRKIRGLLISGLLTPGDSPYTYPTHLRKELMKEIPGYRIHTRTSPFENEHVYLQEAYDLLKARCDATLHFMENYDWNFFVSYFYYTDQIQHVFWKYMDPTHPLHNPDASRTLKDAIPKAYKIVDDSLRKIMKMFDEDTLLIVMSDHGAGPVYKELLINNYLKDLGLVRLSKEGLVEITINSLLRTFDPEKGRLTKFFGYLKGALRVMTHPTRRGSSYFPTWIDWSRTKAYSVGHIDRIMVNRNVIRKESAYTVLINYLIRRLYELRDPESKENVFDKIYRRSEIYWGEHSKEAPDLLFTVKNATYMTRVGHELESNQIIKHSLGSGGHRREGILIMYGNNVRKAHKLRDCSIMDLMPTILYTMGLQIPSDLDGKVITEAFHPSFVRDHPVKLTEAISIPTSRRFNFSKEEKEELKRRLKALGYF